MRSVGFASLSYSFLKLKKNHFQRGKSYKNILIQKGTFHQKWVRNADTKRL